MSEKDDIRKALDKMDAEASQIEAVKNRKNQLIKKHSKPIIEKDRMAEVDQQNREDHQENVSQLKFKTIFIIVSCICVVIYVSSLTQYQRAELVENTVLWGLALGIVVVAMLKR